MSRVATGLFLALLVSVASAQLPEPTLTLTWEGDTLIVAASPGSLFLVGGGRPDTYVGQELISLPAAGVDGAYTPAGRSRIELRANGAVVAWLPIPERERIILPVVVRPP